jgi:hypothetical protein
VRIVEARRDVVPSLVPVGGDRRVDDRRLLLSPPLLLLLLWAAVVGSVDAGAVAVDVLRDEAVAATTTTEPRLFVPTSGGDLLPPPDVVVSDGLLSSCSEMGTSDDRLLDVDAADGGVTGLKGPRPLVNGGGTEPEPDRLRAVLGDASLVVNGRCPPKGFSDCPWPKLTTDVRLAVGGVLFPSNVSLMSKYCSGLRSNTGGPALTRPDTASASVSNVLSLRDNCWLLLCRIRLLPLRSVSPRDDDDNVNVDNTSANASPLPLMFPRFPSNVLRSRRPSSSTSIGGALPLKGGPRKVTLDFRLESIPAHSNAPHEMVE